MSSAIDDDTQQAAMNSYNRVRRLLRSLQSELRKVFVVFVIGFLGSFVVLREVAWPFLRRVTKSRMADAVAQDVNIIAQTPFEVILLQGKIGVMVGILVSLPALAYLSRKKLAARGIRPVKKVGPIKLALLTLVGVFLFIGGLVYGYVVFFPFMFNFLAKNALTTGFDPEYSIALWTQFIFILSFSFGVAAQLPLVIPSLSYYGVVEYETFRDNWRKAVVGMVTLGAVLSPPDPFTQIMWAAPLVTLYGVSLYFAKIVTVTRRNSARLSAKRAVRQYWNRIIALTALAGVSVYAFYSQGGIQAVNSLLATIGSRYRLRQLGQTLPVSAQQELLIFTTIGCVIALMVAIAYYVYKDITSFEETEEVQLNFSKMSPDEVNRVPDRHFVEMSEDEATKYAGEAIDNQKPDTAEAILNRFDATPDEQSGKSRPQTPAEGQGIIGRLQDVADEEAEVGGYLADLSHIMSYLRSKSLYIGIAFGIGVAGTFFWLYNGGLERLFEAFLAQLPPEITTEEVNVITLHPVEALMFEAKLSFVIGLFMTIPLLVWFSWPALRDLNLVSRSRNALFGWFGLILGAFVGGLILGYLYIAPYIISYLATDALNSGMLVTYRISHFFWLIVALTVGIGILAEIPVLMVMLNYFGIPYSLMRSKWRETVFGIALFSIVVIPGGIGLAIVISLPLAFAYATGLFAVRVGSVAGVGPT